MSIKPVKIGYHKQWHLCFIMTLPTGNDHVCLLVLSSHDQRWPVTTCYEQLWPGLTGYVQLYTCTVINVAWKMLPSATIPWLAIFDCDKDAQPSLASES